MKLQEKQHVRHSKFGWGTILECDSNRTIVIFRTVGIKKFVTSEAVFDLIESDSSKKKGAA